MCACSREQRNNWSHSRYLFCNPEDAHDPKGAWSCLTSANMSNAAVSKQCNKDFNLLTDQSWNFVSAPKVWSHEIPGLVVNCARCAPGGTRSWALLVLWALEVLCGAV